MDKPENGRRLLAEQLLQYGRSDYYPLHMPGHKRRLNGAFAEEVVQMDITEIEGFDNLHQAQGILKELQEHAAGLYGADESFYLVNGSTCGILSAISAAVPEGGKLLMARNCHKSAYHACYLRKLTISYLYPQINEEFDICEAITCRQVEETLKQHPDVDAVLIVSPTYEGRIAEVGAIAKAVHAKGIPLIVDEAHGAHLGFAEGFAPNSCRQGADLVIHSVHKTLPALTQSALLHVNGSLIDRKKLKRFLHIYQTSSPSYLLMAGIENALHQLECDGGSLFEAFLDRWQSMCRELAALQKLSVLLPDGKQDPGKLLISVKKTGLSGQQLYDMLLEEYHLQPEMAEKSYVLAMFTVGDTKEGFRRLTDALLTIDKKLMAQLPEDTEDVLPAEHVQEVLPCEGNKSEEALQIMVTRRRFEAAIPLAEAWDMDTEWCALSLSEGRTCAEFINLYPPGTPMAVPGELITSSLISQIYDCLRKGLSVQGITL